MPVPQTFGRRAAPQARTVAPAPIAPAEARAVPPALAVDEELEAWKRARPRPPMPWRQIWLMAGLCFGAASFVLPDSVNDAADWLLYALAAASFYAGWRKRRT